MFVYRYLKDIEEIINNIVEDLVVGTLFKRWCYGEMDFNTSVDYFNKYGIKDEELERINDVFVENFLNKYYLACFSKRNPELKNQDMWKKFSDLTGFCLCYDTDEIQREISINVFGGNILHSFKVSYSSNPYNLDSCYKGLLFYFKNYELSEESFDRYINQDSVQVKRMRKNITYSFSHKKNEFKSEQEFRIIKLVKTKNNALYSPFIKLKPRYIYISDKMRIDHKHRLITYAKENHIPYKSVTIKS